MATELRWACPSCLAVVGRVSEIRYELGLVSVGPLWRCDDCLDQLRVAAAWSEAGKASETEPLLSSSDYIWAIRVDRVLEARAVRGPVGARATPAPSRPRATRGAVTV